MNHYLIIAFAAGLCTALLNLSGYSGGPVGLGFVLVLIASLPIMIASLGWGSFTGLLSALFAGLIITLLTNIKPGLIFLLLNFLPAWWISHLAGLSRQNGETGEMEFYPPGRLLIWIAGICSLTAMAMFIPFGFSIEAYHDTITTLMTQLYKAQDLQGSNGQGLDLQRLIAIVSRLAPTVSAVMLVLSLVISLYFAGRVAQKSGRLTRPWPNLHKVTMAPVSAILFLVGLAFTFVEGLPGIFAQIVTSSFGTALLLVGLSVLHDLTRTAPSRTALLWTTYFLLVIFQWLALFLIILGASEILLNVRARFPRPPAGTGDGTQ